MKRLQGLLYLFIAFVTTLIYTACKDGRELLPEEQQAFLDAYTALDAGDYETYLGYVDMEDNPDSTYRDLLKMVLNQHQERQARVKGSVMNVEIVDSKLETDSVCTVFYKLTFSGDVSEVCSQMMVCNGGKWQLKLRN